MSPILVQNNPPKLTGDERITIKLTDAQFSKFFTNRKGEGEEGGGFYSIVKSMNTLASIKYFFQLTSPQIVDKFDCSLRMDGHYSYPGHPAKYIVCDNGRTHVMSCPDPRMQWNQQIRQCDWTTRNTNHNRTSNLP